MTNPDYFGSHDLIMPDGNYGTITVTIQSVQQENVKGSDGKDSLCIVARTAETKPIILNRTNCKTITKVVGTPIIERWSGQKITLGVERVKAFGETTDAIRVSSVKPVETNKDYTEQINAIQECKDLSELASVWKSFDAATKAATLSHKDNRKSELELK